MCSVEGIVVPALAHIAEIFITTTGKCSKCWVCATYALAVVHDAVEVILDALGNGGRVLAELSETRWQYAVGVDHYVVLSVLSRLLMYQA